MPQTPQELFPPLGPNSLGNLDKQPQEEDAGDEGQGAKRKHRSRGTEPENMEHRRRKRHVCALIVKPRGPKSVF